MGRASQWGKSERQRRRCANQGRASTEGATGGDRRRSGLVGGRTVSSKEKEPGQRQGATMSLNKKKPRGGDVKEKRSIEHATASYLHRRLPLLYHAEWKKIGREWTSVLFETSSRGRILGKILKNRIGRCRRRTAPKCLTEKKQIPTGNT